MESNEKGMGAIGAGSAALLWFTSLRAGKLNGYQFKRQYPVDGFMADFVCQELKLIITIGSNSDRSSAPYDRNEQEELEEAGYILLRFSETEVVNRLDEVVDEIGFTLEALRKNIKLLPN
jgi:very-short-patch-repair endonuclease